MRSLRKAGCIPSKSRFTTLWSGDNQLLTFTKAFRTKRRIFKQTKLKHLLIFVAAITDYQTALLAALCLNETNSNSHFLCISSDKIVNCIQDSHYLSFFLCTDLPYNSESSIKISALFVQWSHSTVVGFQEINILKASFLWTYFLLWLIILSNSKAWYSYML